MLQSAELIIYFDFKVFVLVLFLLSVVSVVGMAAAFSRIGPQARPYCRAVLSEEFELLKVIYLAIFGKMPVVSL
jgi:hypothetical protein